MKTALRLALGVFVLSAAILLLNSCGNDNPVRTWTKVFGGDGLDMARAVVESSDGGYLFAGSTNSYSKDEDDFDIYLAKTDPDGNIIWEKLIGGSGVDGISSIQTTTDGGYVILGSTYLPGDDPSGNNSSYETYLIKMDALGNILWKIIYGQWDASNVLQTPDDSYVIVGSSSSFHEHQRDSDMYLVKTDEKGVIRWEKKYGGAGDEEGYYCRQTSDGGYVVVGRKTSSRTGDSSWPESDFYVVKTDENGNVLWENIYGERGFSYAGAVRQTADGGYIIWGITEIISKFEEYIYLVRTDGKGDLIWEKTYLPYGNNGQSVPQPLAGGNSIISTARIHGHDRISLMKINEDGNIVWEKLVGQLDAQAYASRRTKDGGYIIAADTNIDGLAWANKENGSDFYLLKLDAFGNTQ